MEDQTSSQFDKDVISSDAQEPPSTQPFPTSDIQSGKVTSASPDPGIQAPPRAHVSSSPPTQPEQQSRVRARKILLLLLLISLVLIAGNALLYYITVYSPTQFVLETQAQARQATQDVHTRATSFARIDANAVATAAMESTPGVMATAMAWNEFYTMATSGKPLLNDSLSGQSSSRWDEGISTDGSGSCTFTGGAYHARIQKSFGSVFCLAHAIQFRDFTFQIQMRVLKGEGGGIIFGADDKLQAFYHFYISNSSHPECDLLRYKNGDTIIGSPVFPYTMSCPDTSHQPTLLTIIATNSYLYMFVNKQYVANIKDTAYSFGEIGVVGSVFIIGGAADHPQDEHLTIDKAEADVAFTNAQVWKL